MELKSLLQGAGLGAALMYVFDPERGRRRRALLADQWEHLGHSVQDFLSKTQRDMRNRATGLTHEARTMFRSGHADDRVLEARVRSKLGRHASHPHALDVEAHDGSVVISGPILANEVNDLLRAVRWVRGVKRVESRLDVHQSQDISALQGGGARPGEPHDLAQQNWSPTTRALAEIGGLALVVNCLARRDLPAALLGTAGAALLLRAATNRSLGQLTGAQACPQAVRFQRTVVIQAPVEAVWDFITDFEQVGSFIPSVKEVENLGGGRYRWTLCLPGGQDLSLEERITQSVPQQRLSWESVSNRPMSYMGTVGLQREGENATRVNIHLEYTPPGGVLGDKLASLFGLGAENKFHDAVSRVKTYLETGRRYLAGQSWLRWGKPSGGPESPSSTNPRPSPAAPDER
jgi:uncharacterized membrane protein